MVFSGKLLLLLSSSHAEWDRRIKEELRWHRGCHGKMLRWHRRCHGKMMGWLRHRE